MGPFVYDQKALDGMVRFLEGNWGEIEPFTLQLLCRHAEAIAHEKEAARQTPVSLKPDDFTGVRAFDSVLKDFYRACLAKLPKATREKAEELCEHGLLDREGRRLLLEEGQIQSDYGVDVETLNSLAQERLIRRERRLDSVFCEISHDRLAESIFATRRSKLPKKEQQRIFTLKVFAAVASTLCVISAVLGILAWIAYYDAVTARKEAKREEGIALQAAKDANTQKGLAQQAARDADAQRDIARQSALQAQSSEQKAKDAEKEAKLKEAEARDQSARFERLLTFALGEKFLGKICD